MIINMPKLYITWEKSMDMLGDFKNHEDYSTRSIESKKKFSVSDSPSLKFIFKSDYSLYRTSGI
jgi:hypothetical protein